ncbi:glycoside hydrolase family 127 protein [Bifidobacterium sp. ESL0682]|uniref:glycoside hydrolase family 127 protein n=1 Tax=Bifidobacterium sp. ESL0682 TaxID=2983212 RepID=UPI0023F68FA3|nr:beta-L-arabinofuranosidase domain-containing protein [Bifidobacterium sp. ESL0682]WEV42665.1 glycoside hydrolase family 127 protein [Bifidobacterium sp. ESL0682]
MSGKSCGDCASEEDSEAKVVHSKPLPFKDVTVDDAFWGAEQELVRTQVLPFQWRALNDQVPGASPSYCMHNFKAAAAQNQRANEAKTAGRGFEPPAYTDRGFNVLPADPSHPDPDKFYGFVFQDTDFSKWIEAVGYSLAHHPDPQLEATADGAIDIVCAAQQSNGYLDTYYILNGMDRHFTNLKDYHELYCMGHLIEGAVSYYQGTGKTKLLHAAERFADYVASVFGTEPGKLHGYPGHEIAEMALVRLAEATGKSKYLDLASYFIHQRGASPLYFGQEDRARAEHDGTPFVENDNWPKPYAYYQAHEPVADQREAVGHAVRAGYLYSGVADVVRLTGDEKLSKAIHAIWRNIVDKKLYITGGVGGTAVGESFSYDYDLPNDLAYSETCAAIALVFFARRMLELEPKGEYGDVMELALYNTVLAGMAMDGKSFFYVNPLEVRPETTRQHDARFNHVKDVRQKWFGCACCPPNIARLVESVQEYAHTLSDDGSTLFTHLYIGGDTKFETGSTSVRLSMTSELPWSGKAEATVHVGNANRTSASSVNMTLAFRLPAWAGNVGDVAAVVSASGEKCGGITRKIRDGYLYLSGTWRDGDTATFDFPMLVNMVAANPKVSEDAGKVAFMRGPIVYCAEERDNGDQLHRLHVDAGRVGTNAENVSAEAFDFRAGAPAMDAKGTGEVELVTRPMVRLEVPAWRDVDADSNNVGKNVDNPGEHAVSACAGSDCRQDNPNPEANKTQEAGADSASVSSRPLYARWQPAKREPVTVTLIPYFAWANRGENEMRVFLDIR